MKATSKNAHQISCLFWTSYTWIPRLLRQGMAKYFPTTLKFMHVTSDPWGRRKALFPHRRWASPIDVLVRCRFLQGGFQGGVWSRGRSEEEQVHNPFHHQAVFEKKTMDGGPKLVTGKSQGLA